MVGSINRAFPFTLERGARVHETSLGFMGVNG